MDLAQDGTPLIAAALQKHPEVTAAIGCTDHFAARICQAARDLGFAIPQRLSVMGVGGLDFGPLMSPPLTSIAQNGYEVGRKSVEALFSRGQGRPPRHYELPVRLVPGGSTADVRKP
jgi:LacI family transcriptional regulator